MHSSKSLAELMDLALLIDRRNSTLRKDVRFKSSSTNKGGRYNGMYIPKKEEGRETNLHYAGTSKGATRETSSKSNWKHMSGAEYQEKMRDYCCKYQRCSRRYFCCKYQRYFRRYHGIFVSLLLLFSYFPLSLFKYNLYPIKGILVIVQNIFQLLRFRCDEKFGLKLMCKNKQ
ncbi:hypothetical protein CR513_05826, partial [Mucuna pruriens]